MHFWQCDILFKKGEYAQACKTYYKGKRIAEKFQDEVSLSEYNYYLARMLYRQEKFGKSVFYFNQCLQLLYKNQREFARRYRLQEVLGNLGLCYSKMKEYDSARYYFQQAISYNNNKLNPENDYQKTLTITI